jgi:Competence protein CoiA-like family
VIFARYDGAIARAKPGQRGSCPSCDEEVIAKCGTIVIWHWAHLADRACGDAWAEESHWHLLWKVWALDQGWEVEVPMEKRGVRHRADIVAPSGWVVELQHSALDARQIRAREDFYGRLAWVWDMTEREERFVFNDRGTGFRWKRPMWSLCAIRRPLYLDFGGEEGLLRAHLARKPSYYGDYDVCVGYGSWGSRDLLPLALGRSPITTIAAGGAAEHDEEER